MGLTDWIRGKQNETRRGRRLLFIGHSHLTALELGHRAIQTRTPEDLGDTEVRFANLREDAYKLSGFRHGAPETLPSALKSLLADYRPDRIVLVLQGNEHNVLALVEHPQPFDFELPSEPGIAVDESRALLTHAAVEATLYLNLQSSVQPIMAAILALAKAPVAHLETPPPLDSEHIRTHPGVFREKLTEMPVAPLALRYKMWRVRTRQLHRICGELGVAVIPMPANALDESGMMLKPALHNPDPTHGNVGYGVLAMRAVLKFDREHTAAGINP
jgi:hypothetical protein